MRRRTYERSVAFTAALWASGSLLAAPAMAQDAMDPATGEAAASEPDAARAEPLEATRKAAEKAPTTVVNAPAAEEVPAPSKPRRDVEDVAGAISNVEPQTPETDVFRPQGLSL